MRSFLPKFTGFQVVEEIDLHLAYRRFIGYDLDEAIADHRVASA